MQKNRIWVVVAALAGAVALSVSCQEKEIINPPSLTAFSFKAADNAVLSEDYVATVSGTDINVALPDVDKSALVATFTVAEGNIVGNGDRVVKCIHDQGPAQERLRHLPAAIRCPDQGVGRPDHSGLAQEFLIDGSASGTDAGTYDVTFSGVTVNDFSNPVDYTVTNLDGSVNAIFSVTLNRQKGEWTAAPTYEAVPVHAGARILVNPVDDVPFVAFKRHQPTEADARDPEKDEKMYALKFVDGAWQNIGEAFSDKVGSDYDFTLSPSGTPFIAFKNGAVSPQVTTVMTYAGGSWSTVGENIGTAATSKIHLHAIADNKVVVCQIMSNKTFVGIWDGSSWTTGGIDALDGNPRPYEIRMAGDGANAYMFSINRAKALNDVNYGHNVMKFDGTSWSGLRQNYLREGATQTSIVGYDITVAPDGTVYLVTGDNAEDNENYHHRVEKYNADGTWSQVGGTIDYVLSSRCYSKIAVAPDGTVFVAYPNEGASPKTIDVVYFDAATKQWSAPVSLGNGDGVEYTGDPNLSFVFDSKGKGYLTWIEDSKLLMYNFQ